MKNLKTYAVIRMVKASSVVEAIEKEKDFPITAVDETNESVLNDAIGFKYIPMPE